jgi:transketolase
MERRAHWSAPPLGGLGDHVRRLPDVRARRPFLGARDAEPVLDAVAMRCTDHDVLFERVVRQAGRAEPRDDVALTVCSRRNLSDIGIDHGRVHAGELAGIEQVLDDVKLGTLAIELQIDLVRVCQVRSKPLGRADEERRLRVPRRPELFGEQAGADTARVVQHQLARLAPEPEAADCHALVTNGLERRPAGGARLEAEDTVERVLRIPHREQRRADVSPDVEEDFHGGVPPIRRTTSGPSEDPGHTSRTSPLFPLTTPPQHERDEQQLFPIAFAFTRRILAVTSRAVPELQLIPKSEFDRVDDLALLADMCRANALTAVKRAGSGHLGSSFSALDIVVHLLWRELNVADVGWDDPERDVFFSSKGHDVPGLYAALHALGVIPAERLLRLRRLGGLDGHPDVGVPGIEANSGSLGMGLSKGRGMAWAKTFHGRRGRVVVMTGDGELQEGQNWEAFASASHQGVGNLWAIVDCNELQSDKRTDEILALGDLEGKLRAFGWHVQTCEGHDHDALAAAFAAMRAAGDDIPKALVARTIKGRGVSFMEHPAALREGGGTYRWHAGAPDDEAFARAYDELLERIRASVPDLKLVNVQALEGHVAEPASGIASQHVTDEYVAAAYGEELLQLAGERSDIIVLDADLASDCRIRAVELERPDRFVEVGIAEQDMVSMAAGLARQGLLPVVNSFAAFLAARANEQIYNQASEGTRVVYALHYAGLIPAGPGKSHQSIRDVSLLGALPELTVVQPANSNETRRLLRWAIQDAEGDVGLRLAIGPSPRRIELPPHELVPGRGCLLADGTDGVLFAYGPVMLHEALAAAEALHGRVAVVNMPWLNRIDREWIAELVEQFGEIFVLEDHGPVGALGDALRRELDGRAVTVFGVDRWPACGTPAEALRFHGLDGSSLADRMALALQARATS